MKKTDRNINKKNPASMHVQDMTEGNILQLILFFAVPILIGNIFQQVYNLVDTAVVGHALGDEAIAAIGATSSLYTLVINFAAGLNNGYAIIVTQRFGAHDEKEMKQSIAGMMILDVVVTILLTILALAFLRPILHFMNIPKAILESAYSYIAIICGGMAATIGYNMFAGILRAMGNSRSPLYFLIMASVLNVILDFLFVMGFQMGLAGAAIATVIAQLCAAVLCGIYLFRNYRSVLPKKEDFRVSKRVLAALTSTGMAMALMTSVIDFGSVFFQRANNRFGEALIAAYATSRRIIMMFTQPLVTTAMATSTFVGQNWGAKKTARIQSAIKQACIVELVWSVFACALIYLIGAPLVRLTTGSADPELVDNAVLSLRIHFTFFPPLGILFCLRNAMQAMGQKVAPVLSSCIELVMKLVFAFYLIPKIGFLGTCITEPVIWVIMTSYLLTAYMMDRKKLFAI